MVPRWDGCRLATDSQASWVADVLDEPELLDDYSWGTVDTKVLHVQAAGRELIVKAAGPQNHHIGREITAHETVTEQLVLRGAVGGLVAESRSQNVLVLEYLDGVLVEGTEHEHSPEVHRRAGELLRLLHDHDAKDDEQYEASATQKAIRLLDRRHRIAPDAEAHLRYAFEGYTPAPTRVGPTHGDWQPRNWLISGEEVKVIDFGRYAFRPAATDLCRLAVQQWRGRPDLEEAFIEGYGADVRSEPSWSVELLREAVGTAVWAHEVGDRVFEAQGHRMIAEGLTRL